MCNSFDQWPFKEEMDIRRKCIALHIRICKKKSFSESCVQNNGTFMVMEAVAISRVMGRAEINVDVTISRIRVSILIAVMALGQIWAWTRPSYGQSNLRSVCYHFAVVIHEQERKLRVVVVPNKEVLSGNRGKLHDRALKKGQILDVAN